MKCFLPYGHVLDPRLFFDDVTMCSVFICPSRRQQPRSPLLRESDVLEIDREQLLSRRVSLMVFAIVDIVGILALLLQVTGDGFPRSLDAFAERWDHSLVSEFWFAPLAVSAAFPLFGVLGACLLSHRLLWIYCAFIVISLGVRCYFVFEAGRREGLEDRLPLLLDMMLLTFCVFLQIHIFQSASTLALMTSRLRLQERFRRTAPRRNGSAGNSSRCETGNAPRRSAPRAPHTERL